MKKYTRKMYFVVFMLLFFMLIACKKAAEVKKEKDLEIITLILDWIPNVNHAGFYVAMEKGYYEEEGIYLDIKEAPEDGALPLLAAGKGDFAIGSSEEMAQVLDLDIPFPVTTVAAILGQNTSGIVSLKETGITSYKDLENKRYATWGSPVELTLLATLMEKEGGDFSKVEIIPQQALDPLSALHADIDAIWIYYGTDGVVFEAEKINIEYLPIIETAPDLDYYTPLIVGNNEYLENNRELARAFLAATQKGYAYAGKNPEKAAEILHEYIEGSDINILKRGLLYVSDFYKDENWGKIDPVRWNYFFQYLHEAGILQKDLAENAGFTNEYLN